MSSDIAESSGGSTKGASDAILQIRDLTKEFGGLVAVDQLSFAVEKEEIMGFIGPNGAGKSTTFNCIFGTYKPTGGTIRYHGENVTGFAPHRMVKAGMARTYQTFQPLADRNVLENVALSYVDDDLFTLNGLFGQTRSRAAEICERVGLGGDTAKQPDELPHAGMIRLELARALATDPNLVLVDEPFAGLSSNEVADLSQLFKDLRDSGLTLIVVDHNMRGLFDLIDRAIVINFGSKIAEGSPAELKQDETVQEAYLGGAHQ